MFAPWTSPALHRPNKQSFLGKTKQTCCIAPKAPTETFFRNLQASSCHEVSSDWFWFCWNSTALLHVCHIRGTGAEYQISVLSQRSDRKYAKDNLSQPPAPRKRLGLLAVPIFLPSDRDSTALAKSRVAKHAVLSPKCQPPAPQLLGGRDCDLCLPTPNTLGR